mgnify:FL=1
MMTPVGRLVLVRAVPKSEFVSAMTWLTIPGLIGPMAGPPLGGFITTYFSWHWIFLINVPIGFLGIWLSSIYLPEVPPRETPKLDWPGFFLSGIAAAGIVFGLSVISLPALPPAVGVVATTVGLVTLVLYVRHARRVPNPILTLKLFRDPVFRLSIVGATIFRVANGAQPFLMPLMLQMGFGLNPFHSGLITFAGAFGAMSTKFVATRALAAKGFRDTMILASAAGAAMIGVAVFFTPETPIWLIILSLYLAGFSRSFLFTSSNSLNFTSVSENDASQATSISSVFQQIATALGVAVAGLILETGGWWGGETLSLFSFHLAFGLTALLSATSLFFIVPLPRDAGADVSGHRAYQAG